MTSNLDRIAALEEQLAAVLRRLDSLEGAPPQRDPASTTNATTERSWTRVHLAPGRAFGFGPPGVRA